MSPLKVGYLVFPRSRSAHRISKSDSALIEQLQKIPNVELEVFTLVLHKRLRWTHSVLRALRGDSGWPADLEKQVQSSISRTSFVSYAPLPNATIESATFALAVELIRRPSSDRPKILYGSTLDMGGFAAVQVAKSISCTSVVICEKSIEGAQSRHPVSLHRRQRIALRDAHQIISTTHELSAQIAKGGRKTTVVSLSQNTSDEQNYWSEAQATLEAVHRNILS